jgi:hypothetical protein
MDIPAEVERGMAEEHLLQPDSNEGFTTSNYAVRCTLFTQGCNKFAHQTHLEPNPGKQHSLCPPCGSFLRSQQEEELCLLLINFMEKNKLMGCLLTIATEHATTATEQQSMQQLQQSMQQSNKKKLMACLLTIFKERAS